MTILAGKDDFILPLLEHFVGLGVEGYARYSFGAFGALVAGLVVTWVIQSARAKHDPEYAAEIERESQAAEVYLGAFVKVTVAVIVGSVSWAIIAGTFPELESMGSVGAAIAVVPSVVITVAIVFGLYLLEKNKPARGAITKVVSPVFRVVGFTIITAIVFAILWAIMTRVFPELETMGRLGGAIVVVLSAIVTAIGYVVHSLRGEREYGAE
jgi:hypothetical protein